MIFQWENFNIHTCHCMDGNDSADNRMNVCVSKREQKREIGIDSASERGKLFEMRNGEEHFSICWYWTLSYVCMLKWQNDLTLYFTRVNFLDL